jgi:tetratricopeptide (TPR) repeat protein
VAEFKELPETLSALEAKVTATPGSPFFARVASAYLRQGKTMQAIELCAQGLKTFPDYATGHLVLGQCYEALGRTIEAMLEYRRALKILPDNPAMQKLMRDIEQREKEAFVAFAEERARKLTERKDSLSVEEYLSEEPTEKESTVEFLLKRLQVARRAAPGTEHGQSGATDERPASATISIVTPTLAEIYASQGEYDAAIDAYGKLVVQRPQEAERYEKRIAQLEQLKKLKQAEQRP